eukprot:470466_1
MVEQKENRIVIDPAQNNDDKEINTNISLNSKMDIKVDLTVFANSHAGNEFDKCESEHCASLKRLVTASTYYSKLNIIDNDTHYALFDDFIHNIYFGLINDYIHFNNQHTHQIEQIKNGLQECNINTCKCTFRHHETE